MVRRFVASEVEVWQTGSARMYTALLEQSVTPGQDGMRFALFLINFAVFKDLYSKQVSRATVRPWCHLLLRQQTWQEKINLLKHSPRSRRWSADVGIASSDFQAWSSSRRHLQASQPAIASTKIGGR